MKYLSVYVQKRGYAMATQFWPAEGTETITLPQEQKIVMFPAESIGGIVKDEKVVLDTGTNRCGGGCDPGFGIHVQRRIVRFYVR